MVEFHVLVLNKLPMPPHRLLFDDLKGDLTTIYELAFPGTAYGT